MGLIAAQVARFAGEERFVDDAWISFRVARNLLEHGVLTFDATQPPVEGATNLAWVLISAAQQAVFPVLDPALFARLLGMLCLGGILWVWTGLAARRAPENPGVAALVVAVLVGAAGNLAFHALGGLETGLYALCFAGGLAWAWPDPDAPSAPLPHPVALGALLVLLAATRPEGVPLGALLLALGWRRPGS